MPDFRYVFAVVFLVFQLQGATASEPSSLATSPVTGGQSWGEWEQARSLYDAGKYDDALIALMSKPRSSDPNYYYNAGVIFFRLGRFGHSLAFFEKANRLQPHDQNIQANLKIIRATISSRIGQEKMDASSSFLENLADRVSLDEVRATLGLLAFALGLLLTRFYLRTRRLGPTMLHPASLVVLAAALITTSLYVAQRYSDTHPPVICVQSDIIRSGPGARFLELARVEPGTKLRLTGVSSLASDSTSNEKPITWQQVRFSPEAVGWINSSSLLLL